jgi:hypothetical protein
VRIRLRAASLGPPLGRLAAHLQTRFLLYIRPSRDCWSSPRSAAGHEPAGSHNGPASDRSRGYPSRDRSARHETCRGKTRYPRRKPGTPAGSTPHSLQIPSTSLRLRAGLRVLSGSRPAASRGRA